MCLSLCPARLSQPLHSCAVSVGVWLQRDRPQYTGRSFRRAVEIGGEPFDKMEDELNKRRAMFRHATLSSLLPLLLQLIVRVCSLLLATIRPRLAFCQLFVVLGLLCGGVVGLFELPRLFLARNGNAIERLLLFGK